MSEKNKKIKNQLNQPDPKEILSTAWIADEFTGEIQEISPEGAYTYSEDNMAIDIKDNYHDYKVDGKPKEQASTEHKKPCKDGKRVIDMSKINTKL